MQNKGEMGIKYNLGIYIRMTFHRKLDESKTKKKIIISSLQDSDPAVFYPRPKNHKNKMRVFGKKHATNETPPHNQTFNGKDEKDPSFYRFPLRNILKGKTKQN